MRHRAVIVTRRSFLAALNLSLGGLALGLFPERALGDEPSGTGGHPPLPSQHDQDGVDGLHPSVLLHIARDGAVTIVNYRSEMGQGIKSSIPVLVADELGADLARVTVVQADGDAKYGDQNTDGSTSIRKGYHHLRCIGATARTMLIAAAARRWKVRPETCKAWDGRVVHAPTRRSLGFGELVPAASKMPVPAPESVKVRPESELVHVNSPFLPLVDGEAIVTGRAVFGADVKVPGALVAVIARPPVVGGKVAKLDAARALAIPGVRKVVRMPEPAPPWKFQPWGGVAVIADDTWAALRGRGALEITWDHGENAGYDSEAFRETLRERTRAPGVPYRKLGDAEAALAKAARVVEAEYTVPHLPQMPMEPPAAVARFAEGRCEIWAPTQHPQGARAEAARVLGVGEENVTVHVTLLGGAFGRKSMADFVAEAAFLAREAGAPVRLQWTREDDVRHAYYNAINAQRIRAGLDERGGLVAWHQRTAFPPISSIFTGSRQPNADDLQQGVLDLALSAPDVRAEACAAEAHVRIGWYRSVYNIFHAFAAGSMFDEIAHARGADPRDALLEIIGPPRKLSLAELGVDRLLNYGEPLDEHPVDAGRLRRVIERVTAAARWDARRREGRALGLAAHRSFVAYSAVVLSVVPDPRRKVRVDEAWISIDAGTVVNQDRVRAQMEGAVIMGIGNAMFGGVTMKGGATVESNFHDARIVRIGDAPRAIHVDVVPGGGPPCGVGEPGVPPITAAFANAVFALTGQRLRDLPFARALGAEPPRR